MMKGERGFTLVELLIATAITGFIFSVLGAAMHQVVTIPEYGNDRVTALHELQNVAHWVNLDGQMAKSATGGDELVLTLPDDSSISYTLVGTDLHPHHQHLKQDAGTKYYQRQFLHSRPLYYHGYNLIPFG